MSDELLPCPFCGGKAVEIGLGVDSGSGAVRLAHVGCANCPAEIYGDIPDDWNRRVSPWIKASDRLPPIVKEVIIATEHMTYFARRFLHTPSPSGWRWRPAGGEPIDEPVIYWMPVPNIPKEAADDA